jgi:glycosyltransferase involved in cell wall biosynthesis
MIPTISIVVPVYNLEKIVADTLNSIIAQDYPNTEILVINDGSTDGTYETANNVLSKSGMNYRIFSYFPNRGVAYARNTGLSNAHGKYVVFLDGDDMFDPDMLSLLYKEAARCDEQCDIVLCGHRKFEPVTGKNKMFPLKLSTLRGRSIQQLVAMRILNKLEASLCALYRLELLSSCGLRFTEGCLAGEDGEFFIKALSRSHRISFIEDCPYIYIQHETMGSRQPKSKDTLIRRYEDNLNSVVRYAKYINTYTTDKHVRKLIDFLLVPQSCQKKLSVCAMKNDRSRFDRYLKKVLFRKLLRRSYASIFIKPEVFFKTLIILLTPDAYYKSYSKRYCSGT